jgi:hypothetical protein
LQFAWLADTSSLHYYYAACTLIWKIS